MTRLLAGGTSTWSLSVCLFGGRETGGGGGRVPGVETRTEIRRFTGQNSIDGLRYRSWGLSVQVSRAKELGAQKNRGCVSGSEVGLPQACVTCSLPLSHESR